MKFYNNLYFIILKNLSMPNTSFLFFIFFIFVERKRAFLALLPDAEGFQQKKGTSLNFLVANTVLILLFSYAERYFDESLWKKMPFVI